MAFPRHAWSYFLLALVLGTVAAVLWWSDESASPRALRVEKASPRSEFPVFSGGAPTPDPAPSRSYWRVFEPLEARVASVGSKEERKEP